MPDCLNSTPRPNRGRSRNHGWVLVVAMITGWLGGGHFTQAAPEHPREFLHETATEYRFQNGSAQLMIRKSPWLLRVTDQAGVTLVAEPRPPAFRFGEEWSAVAKLRKTGRGDQNTAEFEMHLTGGQSGELRVTRFGACGFHLVATFPKDQPNAVCGALSLAPVEEIYGFGEMWNGHVAQRGQSFELWDRSGTPDACAYMPYYVSTRNYAFFLNYGGKVTFDVGKRRADELTFEAPTTNLDLTLVTGTNLASTVQAFLTPTGLPPIPPRWSFEPWFWLMGPPDKPGGRTDELRGEHTVEMVTRLRELNIPVGVTWFEPPWQDARTSFKPNAQFCSDLKELIGRLNSLGVKTLAWTVPYTTQSASNWMEAVTNRYLVRKPVPTAADGQVTITASGELTGNSYTYLDYYNPAACRWWQNQIEAALDLGFRGFKLDAGQDLPEDALLWGGRLGRDVRNSYALEYDRVFFEALQRRFGADFLMIPRAAWVGSARVTNFKWPGDLSGSFANNGLPATVYSSLSLAFCGLPFVSTDIGGFEGRPPAENVWIRWAQFGALLPGMQTLHMPWWYSAKAQAHFRYLAWLHTDLTPLWMSLAHEAHETGAPVCRPLVWSFQDDVDCRRVDDEFTVGTSLLVAPIINSERQREVYLPKGDWYDFWTAERPIHSPRGVTWTKGWEESLWMFPLYVRAGAIIPMDIRNEVTGFGSKESAGFVTLAIWPTTDGSASQFVLQDTEAAVPITTAWNDPQHFAISCGPSAKNYLLRIHLDRPRLPVEVREQHSPATLTQADSLAAFRAARSPQWYFEAATQKLWIRTHASGVAISLK